MPYADRVFLVNQLSTLFPILQQNLHPLNRLLVRLVHRKAFTFADVQAIQPTVDFVKGLSVPISVINNVTLYLLEKASENETDAGVVARGPEITVALIRLWLCTHDEGVAQKAISVLTKLIMVGHAAQKIGEEENVQAFISDQSYKLPMRQGSMWRRVFRDKDIYGLIFSFCSLSTVGQERQPNKRQKTLAQGRLLEWLQVFPDPETVRTSQIQEVEESYGVEDGGLFEFAVLHMVDYNDDVLMHMDLIDFLIWYLSQYKANVKALDSTPSADLEGPCSSTSLDYLITKGLHARTMSYYLEPEKYGSLDIRYLYSGSATYVSVYMSSHQRHLLHGFPLVASTIRQRLTSILDGMNYVTWVNDIRIPKVDLHVLVSLPRAVLLPGSDGKTPLFSIVTWPGNEDAFLTLARVFSGHEEIEFDLWGRPKPLPEPKDLDLAKYERRAARALYFLYLEKYPKFWGHAVNAADTFLFKENAVAAVELMKSVITAEWEVLPESPDTALTAFPLPTESQLMNECRSQSLPTSGTLAMITGPALEHIIPFLLTPPICLGTGASIEEAEYKVSALKHDLLILLHQKLKDLAQDSGPLQEVIEGLEKRIEEGLVSEQKDDGTGIGWWEAHEDDFFWDD